MELPTSPLKESPGLTTQHMLVMLRACLDHEKQLGAGSEKPRQPAINNKAAAIKGRLIGS